MVLGKVRGALEEKFLVAKKKKRLGSFSVSLRTLLHETLELAHETRKKKKEEIK